MGCLKGAVAVVTGATGGLGSALAEALFREGARVALAGRRREAGEALARRLDPGAGGRARFVSADVLEPGSLAAAREEVLAAWGRIDVLVNAAGGNDPRATAALERLEPGGDPAQGFFGLPPEGFEAVHRLNFTGTLLSTQAFGRAMLGRGGSVVNVSSMAALRPLTRVAGYSAAKAAVESLTRWLAVHLAPSGIRVNALAPGFFLTEQNRFLLEEKAGGPTPRGRKVLGMTPLGRYGRPEELAGALVFLAGPASTFVTGAVLPVDGGFSAYPGV